MARFEPSIDQFFPNIRQVLFLRTKQIHTLASGDLSVEVVLFRDLSDRDQAVGGNLSGRHSGHYRESSISLNIGKETIVRILIGVMDRIHNVLVDSGSGRDQVSDRRLAHLTTETVLVFSRSLHDLGERGELLDLDNVEKIRSGELEMRAKVITDRSPSLFHLGIEDVYTGRNLESAEYTL